MGIGREGKGVGILNSAKVFLFVSLKTLLDLLSYRHNRRLWWGPTCGVWHVWLALTVVTAFLVFPWDGDTIQAPDVNSWWFTLASADLVGPNMDPLEVIVELWRGCRMRVGYRWWQTHLRRAIPRLSEGAGNWLQ